ncbi:MAG TPA: LCP family protein [Acidimicrobiia bacterium]|nr:LCP family protein [Acidimicrobiia bacterium]
MGTTRASLRAFARRYVIALLVAAVAMVGAVITVNKVIDQKVDRIPRVKLITAAAPPSGENFLLLGSDTRSFVKNQTQVDAFGNPTQEAGARSDTLMVVHVEPAAERTLIVSFPRDLWVPIAGHGSAKINAAFNFGPQTVIDTLKQDFDIDIHHYMDVNFESFRGIVDAIGRVPIYFPYPARDLKTGLHFFVGGCLDLSGTQALEYVRSRSLQYYSPITKKWFSPDPVPDIGRIKRQQEFIQKLAGLAVQESLANPLTANDVADEVVKNLQADAGLTKDDIFKLIDAFRTINPNDSSSLQFATLPWKTGPNQQGQQVLYVDEPAAAPLLDQLRTFNGSAAPKVAPGSVRMQVLNGSGRNGAAQGALDRFTELGFVGTGATNNPGGRVAQTEVRYAPGQEDKGRFVLRYISPQAKLVQDSSIKGADVVVVLGTDFQAVTRPAVSSGGAATTPTTAAPAVGGPTTTTAPFNLPGAAPRTGC